MSNKENKILADYLLKLFPENYNEVLDALLEIVKKYKKENVPHTNITESDAILIVYPDHLHGKELTPLATLSSFCNKNLKKLFSGIHLLPFFPYSSDDGFSVIDYRKIKCENGSWEDVSKFEFSLVFDAVINHISSKSEWFQKALDGDPGYIDYFIWEPENPVLKDCDDIEKVTRPRTSPLLTEYEVDGEKSKVWTTFSADQIDLNYSTPGLFLEIMDILGFYISKGAIVFRLDAIAYLWKKLGTNCIHLDETHTVVKIIREVLTRINPSVLILTETNVPHEENISYFGSGDDEAHIVYQFSLPPLILHTIINSNSSKLSQWAESIDYSLKQATYLNFSASHDGVGLRPATGILTVDEIESITEKVKSSGGYISYFKGSDGFDVPYEMNTTFFDAIDIFEDEVEVRVDRFVASQAISMALPGIPAVYFSSLFGFTNYKEGVKITGRARSINREKFDVSIIDNILKNESIHQKIFVKISKLLEIRRNNKSFSPFSKCSIMDFGSKIFALSRGEKENIIHVIQNISHEKVVLDVSELFEQDFCDIITGNEFHDRKLNLLPYQILWLK